MLKIYEVRNSYSCLVGYQIEIIDAVFNILKEEEWEKEMWKEYEKGFEKYGRSLICHAEHLVGSLRLGKFPEFFYVEEKDGSNVLKPNVLTLVFDSECKPDNEKF